jgi:hypothetical protein
MYSATIDSSVTSGEYMLLAAVKDKLDLAVKDKDIVERVGIIYVGLFVSKVKPKLCTVSFEALNQGHLNKLNIHCTRERARENREQMTYIDYNTIMSTWRWTPKYQSSHQLVYRYGLGNNIFKLYLPYRETQGSLG